MDENIIIPKKDYIYKEINYTNDRGYHKKIVVYAPTNKGLYPYYIWNMDTSDLCGYGKATKETLNRFFRHYGIMDTIDA